MEKKINDDYLEKKIKILKKSARRHKKIKCAGGTRFWLHGYLADVYKLFLEFGSARMAKKATRRVAALFDLQVHKRAHPLRILIEVSLGQEDNRAKGRWCQALKWAYQCGIRVNQLDGFFKNNKGVAGCAAEFAAFRAGKKKKKLTEYGSSGERSVGQCEGQIAKDAVNRYKIDRVPHLVKPTDKYLIDKIDALKPSANHNLRGPNKRVLEYLGDVYAVVLEFQAKGESKAAARRIVTMGNLLIKNNTHLITVLIEATAATERTRVRRQWARALRYALGWKQPAEKLEWFFEANHGIAVSACEFEFLRISRRRRSLRNMGVISRRLPDAKGPGH
jgi:hypothetical protein